MKPLSLVTNLYTVDRGAAPASWTGCFMPHARISKRAVVGWKEILAR